MTPREVVNKMVTAWNQADRDTYMAVCDPDVVIDGVQRGPAQWAADYDTLHEAFRDCKIEVGKGEAQEGEWYNYEAIFTGTHTGVLKMPSRTGAGEIAPTGRAVRCEVAFCTRVVHDRIAEENGYGFALRAHAAAERRSGQAVTSRRLVRHWAFGSKARGTSS